MFLGWVLVIRKTQNAVDAWAETFGLVQCQELELVVAAVCDWVDAYFVFEEFSFEVGGAVVQGNVIFFKLLAVAALG